MRRSRQKPKLWTRGMKHSQRFDKGSDTRGGESQQLQARTPAFLQKHPTDCETVRPPVVTPVKKKPTINMSNIPSVDGTGTLHVVRLKVLGLTGISVETLTGNRKNPPPSPKQMKAVLAIMKNMESLAITSYSRRLVRAAFGPATVNNVRKPQRFIAVWDTKKHSADSEYVEFEARLQTGKDSSYSSRRSMLHRNFDLIIGLSTGPDDKATPIGAASLPLTEAAKLRGSNGKVALDLPVFNYASLTVDPFSEPKKDDEERNEKSHGLGRIMSIRRSKHPRADDRAAKESTKYDQAQTKDALGHNYYMDPTMNASVLRVELEVHEKEPNIEAEKARPNSNGVSNYKSERERRVVLVHSQTDAIETAHTVLRNSSNDVVGNILKMEPSFEHILDNSDDATVLSLEQTQPPEMDTKQFRVSIVDQRTMDCELSPVVRPTPVQQEHEICQEDKNVRVMDAAIERVLSMSEDEEQSDDDRLLEQLAESGDTHEESAVLVPQKNKKASMFGIMKRKKRVKDPAGNEPVVTVEIEKTQQVEEKKTTELETTTGNRDAESVHSASTESSDDILDKSDLSLQRPLLSGKSDLASKLPEKGLDRETKKRIKSLARDHVGSKGIPNIFSEKRDLLHMLEKHPIVGKLYSMILDDDDDDDSVESWTNYDTAAYQRETLSDDLADLGLLLGEACGPMKLDSFLDDETTEYGADTRQDSKLSSLPFQTNNVPKPPKRKQMPPVLEVDEVSHKSLESVLSEEQLAFRVSRDDGDAQQGKEVNETELKTVLAGALLAAEENSASAKGKKLEKEKKVSSTRNTNFLKRGRSTGSFSKSRGSESKTSSGSKSGKHQEQSSENNSKHKEKPLALKPQNESAQTTSKPIRPNLPPKARSAPMKRKSPKPIVAQKTPVRQVTNGLITVSKDSPDHVMSHPYSETTHIDPLALAKSFVAAVEKAITPQPSLSKSSEKPGIFNVPSFIDPQEIVSVGDLTATSHELKVDIAEFKKSIRERMSKVQNIDSAAAVTAETRRLIADEDKERRTLRRRGRSLGPQAM